MSAAVLQFPPLGAEWTLAGHLGEAREFALAILRDPEYQKNLLLAARARILSPAVEIALMHYAWGKPTERVELGRPGAFENLSPEQLASRARQLAAALEEGLQPQTDLEEDPS